MSRSIKYYYDFLSQPSRALYIFLKITKIPFEDCPVALRKGEHLTNEFRDTINRFQKVPCIIDGEFKLAESVAIFRYLCNEYHQKVPEYWYPKDIKQRALVDEYLEWQHLGARKTCSYYFILKWVRPLLYPDKPAAKEEQLLSSQKEMEKCLDLLENEWLESKKFIVGKTITIADLLAACEIEQPRLAGYDPCEGRPKLRAWLDLVKKTTNPYYDEAHMVLNKIIVNQQQKQSKI